MSLDFFARLKRNVAAGPDQPAIVNLSSHGRELITFGRLERGLPHHWTWYRHLLRKMVDACVSRRIRDLRDLAQEHLGSLGRGDHGDAGELLAAFLGQELPAISMASSNELAIMNNQKGFALIELISVIVLVGIIASFSTFFLFRFSIPSIS